MTKNSNGVGLKLIIDKTLLKFNIYILALGYLKKRAFCFTKIIRKYEKINKNSEKLKMVYNSKKKAKKRFYIKKGKKISFIS